MRRAECFSSCDGAAACLTSTAAKRAVIEPRVAAAMACGSREGVKVAGGGSWGFWGLEKSVKVLRKSLLQAVFFGFGIAGGIDGMRWEMISRNLGAISRVSYSSCARFGGQG